MTHCPRIINCGFKHALCANGKEHVSGGGGNQGLGGGNSGSAATVVIFMPNAANSIACVVYGDAGS